MNARCTGCSCPSSDSPSIVCDVAVLVLDRERQTGIDALTVHQDGARAARTLIASLLRAHQLQAIAQGVQQRDARLDQNGMSRAVHTKNDIHEFVCHAGIACKIEPRNWLICAFTYLTPT